MVTGSLTLGLLLVTAQQPPLRPADVAGHYEFHTLTIEGAPLTGNLHLVEFPAGRVTGRIYVPVSAPLAVDSVQHRDGGFFVHSTLGGRPLTFFMHREGDAGDYRGAYEFGTTRIPVTARLVSRDRDLRPVPCEVEGTSQVARCGVLWVPEDHARPAGRRIPLNVMVLPATGADRAPDPLFHFAGGPGQAATEQAAGNLQRFSRINRRRDIVMVDQRGTGHSNGLYCPFDDALDRAALLFGGGFPAPALQACRAGFADRADTRFYHTAVAADDVPLVARWLGYEQINLYGGSYGTRAALAVLRRHPGLVRTATLRGVMAPSGSLTLDNPRDAQIQIERVFADCTAEPACAAAFPDLARDFAAVMLQLRTAPAPARVRDPLTGDAVDIEITAGVFAGAVRRVLMDADLRRQLPLVIHRAARGDFEPVRSGIERTIGIAGELAWGMGFSVVCAEDPPAIRRRDVAAATAGTFLGRSQVDALLAGCPVWPAGTPPGDYDRPVRADVPTLLLSGALDPTTPPRWGEEVHQSLPRSLHLVLEGVSHAPFPLCAVNIMAEFVDRGSVEALDTGCTATLGAAPFRVP